MGVSVVIAFQIKTFHNDGEYAGIREPVVIAFQIKAFHNEL